MANSNFHAVVIGINDYLDTRNFTNLKYAEKDAQDVYEALCASESFPKENIKLVLGKAATTEELERILFTEVVKKREKDDTVFLYFSGCGFLAGEFSNAYLGTHNTLIERLLDNPQEGLRIDYLLSEILAQSPARRILLLLDCCHSGAFIPPELEQLDGNGANRLKGEAVSPEFFLPGKGKVLLVSYHQAASLKESAQLQNSIFTHFVLKGLKGEAVEENGEVTLDSLMVYLQRMVPTQPISRYGQDDGRFVLAKIKQPVPSSSRLVESGLVGSDILSQDFNLSFLQNPLEGAQDFVTDLVSKINQSCTADGCLELQTILLNNVRDLFQADFVVVMQCEPDAVYSIFQSDSTPSYPRAYQITIAGQVVKRIVRDKLLQNQTGVLYSPSKGEEKIAGGNAILFVFLQANPAQFIVLMGVSPESPLASDVHAVILRSLYFATAGFNAFSSLAYLEENLIDDLKTIFKFVPLKVYERRFQLFSDRVQKLIVHFQPVLYLDPNFLHICGWEALARDPETGIVPKNLFQIAESWGTQFCVELDRQMILTAIHGYRAALSRAPGLRRAEDIKDLSINVYPQSLIHTVYHEAVGDVIREKILPPENLILEISEKSPIPKENEMDYATAVSAFRKELTRYVKDYRIGFAIDDFGIGYGSISRLLGLFPNYVKIDRNILINDHSEVTLSFIINLIQSGSLHSSKIVVEGYEESPQKLSLRDLYRIGIRYVQGYLVGSSGPDLYRFDKSLELKMKNLLGRDS